MSVLCLNYCFKYDINEILLLLEKYFNFKRNFSEISQKFPRNIAIFKYYFAYKLVIILHHKFYPLSPFYETLILALKTI